MSPPRRRGGRRYDFITRPHSEAEWPRLNRDERGANDLRPQQRGSQRGTSVPDAPQRTLFPLFRFEGVTGKIRWTLDRMS
jgi:hypothetical protein